MHRQELEMEDDRVKDEVAIYSRGRWYGRLSSEQSKRRVNYFSYLLNETNKKKVSFFMK